MNFTVAHNCLVLNRFEAEGVQSAIARFRELGHENATLIGPLGYIVATAKNSSLDTTDAEIWIRLASWSKI